MLSSTLPLLVLACASVAPAGYEKLNVDLGEHLAKVGLGPGDVFEVRVYGEKDLSGPHRVAPDGTINFPLVGRVAVENMPPTAVAAALKNALTSGYLRDPYVSVFVTEYNSKKVFVLGEVRKPGRLTYAAGMNIVEAIALAGDFKGTANQNYVVVTRMVDGSETRIPVPVEKIAEGLAQNFTLQPGDIVFVPDRLL